MIINGASRRSVAFWSKHLANDKANDRVEVIEIRGLGAENLRDALIEMQDDAKHTRLKNTFYQANFNPPPDCILTESEWDRAFEIFEKHRGIPEGTARVVIEHEKQRRVHRHVVWSRVNSETLRAWPDALDAKICHAASREISEELGLDRTFSPFDKDREGPRPERAPKSYETFRGLRSGFDPREVKAEVTEIFRGSENAADFIIGLREHGYQIVQGERRDYCILDGAGEVHSLARRLDSVNAKQLRAFMADIDRDSLPTIDQARTWLTERQTDERLRDLATVEHEIEWEEKLLAAAIEKEKTEDQFVEPTNADLKRNREGERKWPLNPPKSQQTETSPQHHFEDAAREASRPEPAPAMPENLRGTAKIIWEAYRASDGPKAFAAALREHQIELACVSKEEAEKSNRDAAFAKEVGGYSPRYSEDEIVAVYERGQIYRINRRTTGDSPKTIDRFLKPLDRSCLKGIEETREAQRQRAAERTADVQAFRDRLRDMNQAKRLGEATATPVSAHPKRRITLTKLEKSARSAFDKASRGSSLPTGALSGAAHAAADAFASLLGTPLTPEQRLEQEIAARERQAREQQGVAGSDYLAAKKIEQEQQNDPRRMHDRDR
jgi:hypothetical protein